MFYSSFVFYYQVEGVAFKKTFSYAGFEMQQKEYSKPKIALLNIELVSTNHFRGSKEMRNRRGQIKKGYFILS